MPNKKNVIVHIKELVNYVFTDGDRYFELEPTFGGKYIVRETGKTIKIREAALKRKAAAAAKKQKEAALKRKAAAAAKKQKEGANIDES
ncbi:MAG: hypothetical protein K8R40_02280 [Anaerolineaceae bacterium]|nr:hypothetical protein [Anaerolineaceae bacterium]